MSTAVIRVAPLHALRVEEDTDVTSWGKDSRRFHGRMNLILPIASAVILVVLAFLFGILPRIEAIQSGTLPKLEATRLVIGLVLIPFLWLIFTFLIEQSTAEQTSVRKASKRGIKRSRSTAKKLGVSVVPVLTKEHVESRIRVDTVLKDKLRERGGAPFSRTESDGIAALLFEDLNRMPIILSLIEDRGMITAAQIRAALDDIEKYPAPLWDGAL